MDTSLLEQDLDQLKEAAVDQLAAATDGFIRWADRVRDPAAPYRMSWAGGLGPRRECGRHQLHPGTAQGGGHPGPGCSTPISSGSVAAGSSRWRWRRAATRTPALLAYKPPNWDDTAEPWPPTAAHKEAMNPVLARLPARLRRGRRRPVADSSAARLAATGRPRAGPSLDQERRAELELGRPHGQAPRGLAPGRHHADRPAAGMPALGVLPAGSAHRLLGTGNPDDLQDHHRRARAAGPDRSAGRHAHRLGAGEDVPPRVRRQPVPVRGVRRLLRPGGGERPRARLPPGGDPEARRAPHRLHPRNAPAVGRRGWRATPTTASRRG